MIGWEEITALLVFAFASTWTPGPNNFLLANAGARFGFRRSIPHMLGMAVGFPFMVFCVAMGLGELFQTQAWFREGLRVIGAAALGWICWRIVFMPFPGDAPSQSQSYEVAVRPWRFWQAAAFQWINPKAWALALGVSAAYVKGEALVYESLLCALPFVVSASTSTPGWVLFGIIIRGFLNTRLRFRVYNLVIGSLMAVSGVLLFADLFVGE